MSVGCKYENTRQIVQTNKKINITRNITTRQSLGRHRKVSRRRNCWSRYRAGPVRKLRRRAVLKNGECNVLQSRISRRSVRFLQDIFTTLVDTQWRWTLLCFTLSFVLSWLGFAVIWWLIAFTHGDFELKHLPPVQAENNWTPCIYNLFSFTSCFLFSIETQHTIGYGSRSTSEECPEAIFFMCIQSIAGVMIQALMVGIVFAKMSRPKQRTQTLLFSRNAVICQRDSELCLIFRVADMRKSHIIGAIVRAQLIRTKSTKEGEILSQHQQELDVGTDGHNGSIFFIWPITIIHKINSDSPFYNMSAEDMLSERFEVVVILEGTIESTGQTTQARSSYLPQEILWGHRFEPMVSYSKERQGYEVDHSFFNSTIQVDTPLCSGRELAEFYRVQDELRHGNGFIIDDDGMSVGPYHDHHHYHQSNNHRPSGLTNSIVRAESLKSDNSLEEHAIGKLYRDSHYKISNPHLLSNNRDSNGQYRIVEIDPDAIQIIGDVELQNLPDSVNREILKNSREIVYEEDSHHDYIKEENFHNKIANSKRGYLRYPLIDEEKKSLSGSRRNLSSRNFTIIDDDKKSLNGSKRNLNGSKKYLLLPLEKQDIWNDCSKNNIYIGSKENLIFPRRNTGSKERLNLIKRGTNCTKPIKEHYDKRRYQQVNVDIENRKYINISDITKHHGATISSPSSDSTISPNDVIVTMNSESIVTPESGFADSQHSGSSPEYFRKELSLPGNSIIQRNRRSYEHAQLQDVNQIIQRNNSGCSSSDSDVPIKDDNNSVDIVQKKLLNNTKQTVSHTSV
ncbi:uncharacterized protein LOC122858232 isoform X3 [Aphidius gifuensis]|uniref:uncharacterized protein LOC122858232 isoform X3 n=1 Tax=Aphidius gifuensis TaxID=684658 RepID=UPI001CDC048D|nr:uncharacterized protein LOC122858232 isoform X3 [Aphidius gifuensis]